MRSPLLAAALVLCACTRLNPNYEGGGARGDGGNDASGTSGGPGGITTKDDASGTSLVTQGATTSTSTSSATEADATSDEGETRDPSDVGRSDTGDEEESRCAVNDRELAACYHFPPEETEVLVDETENPANGVIVGLNALIGAPDGFGYAADVGSDTRITVAGNGLTDLDVFGPLTIMIACWQRGERRAATAGLIDKLGQYSLQLDPEGIPVCRVAGVELAARRPLAVETWWHVACSYDGETLAMFVNGLVVAETPHAGSVGIRGGPLEIAGSGEQGADRLDGHVDAIEVWSRALSRREVCARAGSLCRI
jgi:hypothetical protein